MSIRQVVGAAVRLFGLYLVFGCTELVGNLVASGTFRPNSGVDGMSHYFAVSSGVNLGICAVLALLLLFRTAMVVSWVVPESPQDTELSVDAEALTLVAILVAGLAFFVSGVEVLLVNAATWFFAPKDPGTGSRPLVQFEAAVVVGAAFKAVFGLWLVLGGRGLINAVKALRGLSETPKIEGQGGAAA